MSRSKTNARITGGLFILGTMTGIASVVLPGQLVYSPDYLSVLAIHPGEILLAALLVMGMGFSGAGIGLSLYSVLKRSNETLALGVVVFRLMEGVLEVVSAIGLVVLLALSQEFVKAGNPVNTFFQPLGAVVLATRTWVANGAFLFPWAVAATIYYSIFYRTKLVPRWLSVWGLAGLVPMAGSSLAVVFWGLPEMSPVQGLLNLPIASQEMVLAVWLIVRGYRE